MDALLPHHGHLLREVRLHHDRVRPYCPYQLVLRNHLTAVFDQHQQEVEGLGGERNDDAVAQQQPPGGIDPEWTELKEGLHAAVHLMP